MNLTITQSLRIIVETNYGYVWNIVKWIQLYPECVNYRNDKLGWRFHTLNVFLRGLKKTGINYDDGLKGGGGIGILY